MLEALPTYPSDLQFYSFRLFQEDPHPEKMNLGIGVYVTPSGQPYVMPSVQEAVRSLPTDNFNYTPTSGDPDFLKGCMDLVLGAQTDVTSYVAQATCGGTQACSLFGALANRAGYKDILIADPT
jgi:aspartate/tyrosine/aromatic aminotransferase